MDEKYQSLVQLQEMDQEIESAKERIAGFDPELEELDEPVAQQERDVEAVRTRLDELKKEQRRLERAAEEKRERLRQYEERMDRVRNQREAAAVRTEVDLIRRAVEADEDETVEVMEQVTRMELKLEELEGKLEAARAELEPTRQEILGRRAEVEDELETLEERRQNHVVRLDDGMVRLYERVREGRTKMVLAALTEDGACGHCFSMVPIQQQNELRQSDTVHRCEACGVILYAET